MTLTRTQVSNEALGLFRGAQGQSDATARSDASVALRAQVTWSDEDRAAVTMLFERLLAVKDSALEQQKVLENYRTE